MKLNDKEKKEIIDLIFDGKLYKPEDMKNPFNKEQTQILKEFVKQLDLRYNIDMTQFENPIQTGTSSYINGPTI